LAFNVSLLFFFSSEGGQTAEFVRCFFLGHGNSHKNGMARSKHRPLSRPHPPDKKEEVF